MKRNKTDSITYSILNPNSAVSAYPAILELFIASPETEKTNFVYTANTKKLTMLP